MDERQNMELGARPMRKWTGYRLLAFAYLYNVPPTILVLIAIECQGGGALSVLWVSGGGGA